MKNLKIYLLSLVLLVVASCEFGDTNVDPAKPLDVGVSALLPSLQTGMSFAVGGEYTLFANIMTQHIVGGSTAQQGDHTKYNLSGQTTDGMWQNMYTNVLNIAHIIIEKAKKEESPHYSGMAKVMMAHGLGVMTDTFGDIPYSTAFRSDQGVIATFDSQQDIYIAIQSLLDEAIIELGEAKSATSPTGNDLIYKGNRSSWILAAKSLKAKYYLHLSKVDPDAYTKALQAINTGVMASEGGNMQQVFGSGGSNPRFEFNNQRSGNILMGKVFVDLMTANNDPRKAKLNAISGGYYTSVASPVPYVTFAELKLIEAEALLQTGGTDANIKAALIAGSEASVSTITGSVDAAYSTALGTKYDAATTTAQKLAVLMNEKYVITYSTGLEGWNDYRRTGLPVLIPNPDGDRSTNPGGGIPRRLPYPENERLLNVNIPFKEVNMQKKFWWDK